MSSYFKILLLAMLLPAISFAQNNFKPGYTVTLKGDTVKGEIDYKEWAKNPKSIRFKNSNNQIITCNTKNTSAFGIDQMDYYERFIMPISMDAVNLSGLSTGIDTTHIIDTVFLRKLTKGKHLTLYDYSDQLKSRYIIRDSQTAQPQELVYHQFIDSLNNNQLVEHNYYKNQLTQYALKYKKMSSGLRTIIDRATYNDDIVKIINLINGDDTHKTSGKNRQGTRLFIGAAINRSQLKYSGNINLAGNVNNTTYFPELSFGIDFFQNSNVGRLIFRAEFSLYDATLTASSTSFSGATSGIGTETQKLQQLNIAIAPQIIYNFYNNAAIKAFIGTGVKINASTYPQNSYTVTYDSNNNKVTTSVDDSPLLRKFWYQIPIKAGVNIQNKFEFYGCYNLPASLTNSFLTYSADIATIGIGFNYLFGTK